MSTSKRRSVFGASRFFSKPSVRRTASPDALRRSKSTYKPTNSPRAAKPAYRPNKPLQRPVWQINSTKKTTPQTNKNLLPRTFQPTFSFGTLPHAKEKPSTKLDAHGHCAKRKSRRKILFQMKIAGTNKRNSPGQGGTYKRTPESALPC